MKMQEMTGFAVNIGAKRNRPAKETIDGGGAINSPPGDATIHSRKKIKPPARMA